MFKNRIAIAAGSVAAALLAQILPSRGIPVDVLPASGKRATRIVAGRPPKSNAPRLKRPRTPADFDAVMRAEQKRQRKARKLRWDNAVHLATYYFTRDAVIAAEALDVYHAIEAVA
ncbi:hypothetical protein DIE15_12360 [Burkholderia sp. Bp9031]|uniref:hypothetical protein n=1 Tax=Burkholderia sp. Bp9031 TaxID=2184566 RepID=UPI000F5F2AB2|nr:hypothetical protein [Burkholderia sp. Bp9031]RQZ17259.1 hypothetical protein DIE15_12360 [Burkholderia sp. Bp9031]